jgi:outer membrane protein assembly factor BamB
VCIEASSGSIDQIDPTGLHSKIYCFDGMTGAVKWEASNSSKTRLLPVTGSDGTVFTSNDFDVDPQYQHSLIIALDGATGRKKWEVACDFRASLEGTEVNAYAGNPFRNDWTLPSTLMHWDIWSSEDEVSGPGKDDVVTSCERVFEAIGDDGTLYLASEDGEVIAIDCSTGAVVKSFCLDGHMALAPQRWTFWSTDHFWRIEQFAISAADKIIVKSGSLGSDTVSTFDSSTGKLKWTDETPKEDDGRSRSGLVGHVIGADGTVYCGWNIKEHFGHRFIRSELYAYDMEAYSLKSTLKIEGQKSFSQPRAVFNQQSSESKFSWRKGNVIGDHNYDDVPMYDPESDSEFGPYRD